MYIVLSYKADFLSFHVVRACDQAMASETESNNLADAQIDIALDDSDEFSAAIRLGDGKVKYVKASMLRCSRRIRSSSHCESVCCSTDVHMHYIISYVLRQKHICTAAQIYSCPRMVAIGAAEQVATVHPSQDTRPTQYVRTSRKSRIIHQNPFVSCLWRVETRGWAVSCRYL